MRCYCLNRHSTLTMPKKALGAVWCPLASTGVTGSSSHQLEMCCKRSKRASPTFRVLTDENDLPTWPVHFHL